VRNTYTSQPTHHLSPPKSIIYWLCWKHSSGVKTIPLAAPCLAARTMAAVSLHWLCPTQAISCYLAQLSCQYIIRFKRRIQGYNTVSTGKCLPTSQSNTPSLSLQCVEKAPPWRRQYIRNWHLTFWATARPKVTPRLLIDLREVTWHILIGIYQKMEADCFSGQLVNFYQTTWTHIPEDNDNIGIK